MLTSNDQADQVRNDQTDQIYSLNLKLNLLLQKNKTEAEGVSKLVLSLRTIVWQHK